jgi:hypothetical protein
MYVRTLADNEARFVCYQGHACLHSVLIMTMLPSTSRSFSHPLPVQCSLQRNRKAARGYYATSAPARRTCMFARTPLGPYVWQSSVVRGSKSTSGSPSPSTNRRQWWWGPPLQRRPPAAPEVPRAVMRATGGPSGTVADPPAVWGRAWRASATTMDKMDV